MYWKKKLLILKTAWGVIRTEGISFWQPFIRHFLHFNNWIFPTETPVKSIFGFLKKITFLSTHKNLFRDIWTKSCWKWLNAKKHNTIYFKIHFTFLIIFKITFVSSNQRSKWAKFRCLHKAATHSYFFYLLISYNRPATGGS